MELKKIFAFKDWLSYRQKVGLLVIAGVVCGLGGLFMYLLRAHTYFIGDNPSACVNCHIMTPYYATWSHSSHGRIDHQKNGATCNDCHVPHQNLAVYYGFKAVDGLKHTAYFVGHMEHQAIKAETLTGQVVMDNCIRCHEQLNTEFVKTGRMGYMAQQAQGGKVCWDYAFASHGASFHAPQEVQRLFSDGLVQAQEARLMLSKVLAKHGFIGDVPMPDISTKAKAQEYIGLDIKTLNENKQRFLQEIEPKWIEEAKKNEKLIEL